MLFRSALEAEPLLRAVHDQAKDVSLEISSSTTSQLRGLHDLRQRLVLAELLIEAACFREESRGGHFRTDTPSAQPFWRCHTLQEQGRGIHTGRVAQGLGTLPL